MHRLFVALRPPAAMRHQLLALRTGIPGARWQDDEQLHLTLRFIGEVDRPQAEDVAATLAAIDGSPVTFALAGVGAFETRGAVHTLWAGVTRSDPLQLLHDTVGRALLRAGIAPDRRAFHPHITLARFGRRAADVGSFVADHAALTSAPVTIDHLLLYESRLGREGAHYDVVARYPLTRL